MKQWQPVQVEWLDSMSYGHWQSEKDAEEMATKKDGLLHVSVGMFFKRGKVGFSIVQSRGVTEGQVDVDALFTIPLGAIRKITPLQEAK